MYRTILAVTVMTALFTAPAAVAQTTERAAVVATNEGNIEAGMVNSLVQLLSQAFAAKGLTPVTSADLASPVVLDDKLGAKAQAAGASRLFVLHILRLNFKTLLQVEERALDGHSIYLTTLVPGDVESSNEILPRLADAVLRRVPATETADVTNVTHEETGTHNRSHFVLSIPGGSVAGAAAGGIEAGYQFEASQFALGVNGALMEGNVGNGLALVYVYGDYFFLPGAVTPYAGVGMGFGGTWGPNGGGGGALAEVEAGVEVMRFSHTHVDIGAQLLLPFYNSTSTIYTNQSSSSTTTYQPDLLAVIRIAF